MLFDIVKNENFNALMRKHIQELLLFLFEAEQNFGVLCKIEELRFDPELPESIQSEFRPMTLFFLAGYTFESARIDDEYLIFEAGFGADNLGSFVSVPLLSIMQIIVDETPIFVSLAAPKKRPPENKSIQKDSGIETSMAAFLKNPENEKFKK